MWLATESGTNLNVHYSDAPYTSFSGPVTLATGIAADDIGVVTALPSGKIGVLWSNQNTRLFGFKVHGDGADPTVWSADEQPASQSARNVGLGMADDHMNVAVAADGTLYAAVKTSYDTAGETKIALLVRRPTGTWDDLYEVDQAGTRAIVLLNEQEGSVRVVYTSSEGFNDIVMKTSSTSSISFGPRQTLITGGVNDVTSTKQNWTGKVLVLASSATTAQGGFIDVTGAPANTAPVATNGTLAVSQDTPASGTLQATDADSNPLTYSIVANGTKGTAVVTNAVDRRLHLHAQRRSDRRRLVHLQGQRRHRGLQHRDGERHDRRDAFDLHRALEGRRGLGHHPARLLGHGQQRDGVREHHVGARQDRPGRFLRWDRRLRDGRRQRRLGHDERDHDGDMGQARTFRDPRADRESRRTAA